MLYWIIYIYYKYIYIYIHIHKKTKLLVGDKTTRFQPPWDSLGLVPPEKDAASVPGIPSLTWRFGPGLAGWWMERSMVRPQNFSRSRTQKVRKKSATTAPKNIAKCCNLSLFKDIESRNLLLYLSGGCRICSFCIVWKIDLRQHLESDTVPVFSRGGVMIFPRYSHVITIK